MTDVLFGQSYYLRFDPKLWAAMQPYAPLGTLYAASYIRARGHRVALFDAMLADGEHQWDEALAHHQPRVAVLFEDNFNYLSKMCLLRMREAAITMIGMARKRGCTVVVCGADISDHPDIYLQAGADYVLLGEGEESLAALLDALDNAQPADNIPGVLSLSSARHQRRPDIKNLDALPFPAWDLIDVRRYRGIWLQRHGFFSMNMVTTRGCPYSCNWCAKPIWGQRYNMRSAQNVADELALLRAQYAPDHIWFADDIFGLRPGWVEAFAACVRAAGIRTPFKCLSRADLITPSTARALAEAGCATLWMGAESGSQKVLDAMDKGTRVEDIATATALLKAQHIAVGFFLQFGYPGEDWQAIAATRRMVRNCLPDDIGISVSYPLPGTKFHQRVKAELGAKTNWQDSGDLAMLYRGPYPQSFYRTLHRVVHAEYRLQKMLHQRDWRRLHRAPIEALHLLTGQARLLLAKPTAEAA